MFTGLFVFFFFFFPDFWLNNFLLLNRLVFFERKRLAFYFFFFVLKIRDGCIRFFGSNFLQTLLNNISLCIFFSNFFLSNNSVRNFRNNFLCGFFFFY